ncbi:hypothetical protein Hanom_Chr12g01075811 [Helianthus anomalus]
MLLIMFSIQLCYVLVMYVLTQCLYISFVSVSCMYSVFDSIFVLYLSLNLSLFRVDSLDRFISFERIKLF